MTALLQSAVSPVTRTKQTHYDTFTSASDEVNETKQRLRDTNCTTPGSASFLKRLFFSYANPMMDTGNQRQLNFEDLWEMEGKNCSATALDEFMTHYERYDKSIVKAMMTAYGGEFFLWGLAMLFSTACGLFAPVVLNHVIGALSMVEIDLTDLSVWLGIFFVSRFVNAILSVQMNYALEMIALRLTVALKTLLFQKAMRRRLQTKNGSGVGEISVPSLLGQAIIHMYW